MKVLYPSLDIPFATDKSCEIFYNSKVELVGVETDELVLYLALNRTVKQLEDLSLLLYFSTWKTRKGRPQRLLNDCKSKRFKPWRAPARKPDRQATRRMITEAMTFTRTTMRSTQVTIPWKPHWSSGHRGPCTTVYDMVGRTNGHQDERSRFEAVDV